MDKEAISQKIKKFAALSNSDGYMGLYWGIKIPKDKLSNAKKAHNINENDYVFFLYDDTFWGSAQNGILATDKGLSFRRDDKKPLFISWESMESIFYLSTSDLNITVKFGEGKQLNYEITGCEDNLPNDFIDLLNQLIDEEKNIVITGMDYFDKTLPENILEANTTDFSINRDSLLKIIKICDDFLKSCKITSIESNYDVAKNIYTHYEFLSKRAISLYLTGDLEQAKEELLSIAATIRRFIDNEDNAEYKDDFEKHLAFTLELLAKIAQYQNKYDDAIVHLSNTSSFNLDGEQQRRIRSSLKEIREQLDKSLITGIFDARQVILCTQQIPSQSIKEFRFASIDALKSTGWKFPVGHPIENTLYVCHPLRPNQYFLIDEFHGKCFDDKYSELVYLLESLGASYIHVEALSGIIKTTCSTSNEKVNASGNLATRGISIKRDANIQDEQSQQVQRAGSWDVNLIPHGLPYIPEDLAWFHHEPIWQRLAQSCVMSRCKEFTIELSQREDFSINSKRFREIECGLEAFIKKLGSIKLFHRQEAENNINQIKNTVWKIIAKFSEPVYQTVIPYSPEE